MDSINKVVVFGCSFSYGSELYSEEDIDHKNSINYCYGKFLSEKLNCKYKNLSLPGTSNFEISRRIFNYISENDINNELIIIGWTDLNRFSFNPKAPFNFLSSITETKSPLSFSSYSASNYELNKLTNKEKKLFSINKKIIDLKNGEEFVLFFNNFIFNTSFYLELNYMLKAYTSTFLKSNNIKHLTFSALPSNFFSKLKAYEKMFDERFNLLEIKDNFNFYDKYYKFGTHKGGHIKKEGHLEFTNFLYNELYRRNIL